MSYVKNKIFLGLEKSQKTALCNYLRALVKKSSNFGVQNLCQKFFDDEKYYFDVKNPHFEFLEKILDEEDFKSEVKIYVEECRKYYDYKESQRPLIEKQKEFEKQKRKFLQNEKMK